MNETSIIIVILLWISVLPSAYKYYNLSNKPDCDEMKIKKAKRSFYWSLFFTVGGTIATILGI